MDKDLVTVLSAQDGEFNEDLGAYVSVYPTRDEDELVVELEYVNRDLDDEVIQVKRFSLYLNS
jgi:hypothetical protein